MKAGHSIEENAVSRALSPFSLDNDDAYRQWREAKLQARRSCDGGQLYSLPLERPFAAVDGIANQLFAFNCLLFETDPDLDDAAFLALNRRFGLHRLDAHAGAQGDSVAQLRIVEPDDPRSRYIPYTDRALNWHTDGYYNPPRRSIQSFALFCRHPAAHGGETFLLDHEWVYLQLRDTDARYIDVLMSGQMMQIPANQVHGRVERAAQSGPVFSVDAASGALHMRYSSRPRYVVWRDDAISRRALACLREILNDSDAIVEHALKPGQGVLCNNILHGRHAFRNTPDRPPRLVLRARYLDRIQPPSDVLAG